MGKSFYGGIEVGASTAKAVIIDAEKNLLGMDMCRSGYDFSASASQVWRAALDQAGIDEADVKNIISTGYGRRNIEFVHQTKTEISCHARGCRHHFPFAITVIDIGGQDNKIIKLDQAGRRLGFKMNRKCAAGTGAFLEEIAYRLNIDIASFDGLARRSTEKVTLGSYCTVFSATEVLEKIRAGKKIEDIVSGLFTSVINRVLEMDSLTDQVVLTGGVVAHNPFIAELLSSQIDRPVLVPPHPQMTGALGAALLSLDENSKSQI
ncbi:MAG: ATPase [Deltaproteobacteria bacterium]|nr:ATPase [Deltaproteobacteria bacterium]